MKRVRAVEAREQQVEHVMRLLAVRRNRGQHDVVLPRPSSRKTGPVALPDGAPLGLDPLARLQLREQEGGEQFRRKPRRTDVHPGVLVHVAAEERRPVGALLPNDLGARDEVGVVEQDRPAFAALDVLRLVEALRRHQSEAAELPAAVAAEEAVGVVLDDGDPALARDAQDRVHLATHSRVVDDHDRLRARRQQFLEPRLVEIEGVRAHVREHRSGSAQHERVHRRHEREGRHDDLVAGLDAQQQRGHLQRVGAGRRQHRLRRAGLAFEDRMATACEVAVAGQVLRAERVGHVLVLGTGEARPVEGHPGIVHRDHSPSPELGFGRAVLRAVATP